MKGVYEYVNQNTKKHAILGCPKRGKLENSHFPTQIFVFGVKSILEM